MTQPNQSELETQTTRNRVDKNELEQLLDCLYEKGYDAGDGMSKYPKDIAILETEVKIERLITANYTPNSTVESLNSQIAWLDGKVEEMREEVAERERVARIDELNRLMDYTDENEIVCVCEQASVQVCDHNWSLCHTARERIAELEKEQLNEISY